MTIEDDRQAIAELIAPAEIRINGDRALCESNAQIVNRSVLHSVEVDMLQYAAAERWLAGEA